MDPTFALILSQVALSFGIPFALIPLVNLTARPSVMGRYANKWFTTAAGILVSVLLISLERGPDRADHPGLRPGPRFGRPGAAKGAGVFTPAPFAVLMAAIDPLAGPGATWCESAGR